MIWCLAFRIAPSVEDIRLDVMRGRQRRRGEQAASAQLASSLGLVGAQFRRRSAAACRGRAPPRRPPRFWSQRGSEAGRGWRLRPVAADHRMVGDQGQGARSARGSRSRSASAGPAAARPRASPVRRIHAALGEPAPVRVGWRREGPGPQYLRSEALRLSFREACGAAGCCPSSASRRARSRPGRAARAGRRPSG